jgi:Na+/phosphate symporter
VKTAVEEKSSRAESSFRYIIVFLAGGFLVHALVMLINEATGFSHVHGAATADKWLHLIISPAMFPMIAVYGALSAFCYVMYQSRKRAVFERELAHLEVERTASTIDTFAALSAVIIDLVATQNNRIIGWVATKENKGAQVSATVKEASRNIARILRVLSGYNVEITPRNRSEERSARRRDILDHFLVQLEARAHAVVADSTAVRDDQVKLEVKTHG